MGKLVGVVGKVFITNEGYKITIIEYFNNKNCTIKFDDGLIITNREYRHIKDGNIKNPHHKSVHGVGYMGIGEHKGKGKIYMSWTNMLARCYDKKIQLKQPAYIDCSVHKDWHNFQNFATWYKSNYKDGFTLDKDILLKGNKVYSPDNCCLVPNEINVLFTKRKNLRGDLPIGVSVQGRKFQSQHNYNGKTKYLGLFDTIIEAFEAYKKAKESHIKEVAMLWRPQITNQVFEAMIHYKVEITD